MEPTAFRKLCDSLNELSPGQRQTMLELLLSRVWQLEDTSMPWIEQLYDWHDVKLRPLLAAVPLGILALALKGRSSELRERISQLLAEGKATELSEEMKRLGPTRLSLVEKAQAEIRRWPNHREPMMKNT